MARVRAQGRLRRGGNNLIPISRLGGGVEKSGRRRGKRGGYGEDNEYLDSFWIIPSRVGVRGLEEGGTPLSQRDLLPTVIDWCLCQPVEDG